MLLLYIFFVDLPKTISYNHLPEDLTDRVNNRLMSMVNSLPQLLRMTKGPANNVLCKRAINTVTWMPVIDTLKFVARLNSVQSLKAFYLLPTLLKS